MIPRAVTSMQPCPTCGLAVYQRPGRRSPQQCWRCKRSQPLPRVCETCGGSIDHRPTQSRYCADHAREANRLRDRLQRRERYAAEQRRKLGKPALDDVWDAAAEAQCAPRDLALEAEIDRHLAAIRARGGYSLTPEIIWARRSDPVQAVAPEASDWPSEGSHSPASRERSKLRQRACRARQAQRRGAA